jgi:hypothetical protein
MERSISNALVFAFVLAPAAVGTSGCMTHTRGDDAGVSPDAYIFDRCDGCSPARDTPADPCADQDARGEGPCDAELGYVWRSGGCWPISGCSCVGADCSALAPTADACLTEHARCDRFCGGLAEVDGCLSNEFCDYPDGSFCGGDTESTGVCTARPDACPDPGGVPVCGCDGREYLADCSAYLAGTDIRNEGPCVTTAAYDTAMAEADCGPADGPAWTLTLATDRTACDETRTDGSIRISVWHALEGDMPGTVYDLGEGFAADGQAVICGRPGEPCAVATGTFTFSVFAVGEVARFSFEVRTTDGRRFAQSDVEVALWWCRTTSPGCG